MSDLDTGNATADPYASYRHLRDHAPVFRDGDGPFQVSRHADVLRILRDHDTFSSDVAIRQPQQRRPPSMLFSDPPVHNRLRKLVSYAFKPAHIARQRELITERCEALVVALKQHKEADLVTALAAPLPVTVIACMLGIEEGDIGQFKRWSDTIFTSIGDILLATPGPEVEQASAELDAYFLERIGHLRDHPAEHLLGRLVRTRTEDGDLSDEELLQFCRLLLIAGNETTTGLITASVRIFHEMPWTFARLKQEPGLLGHFIEEALRFYSPFSMTIRRASVDTVIEGVAIAQGSLVLPILASANRDERVFERADEFVIDRQPNPHVAFGFGIHFCLGALLARLEGEIAVASLLRHLAHIELTGTTPPAGQLGGPDTMPVRLRAA